MPPRVRTRNVEPEPVEGEVVESTDTAQETHTARIGPLLLEMRRPTPDQFAVLAKAAMAAERDPANNTMRTIQIFFRIVEKLLVIPEDVVKLDDAIIDGDVTIKQITNALSPEDVDAPATAAKRVRRAR